MATASGASRARSSTTCCRASSARPAAGGGRRTASPPFVSVRVWGQTPDRQVRRVWGRTARRTVTRMRLFHNNTVRTIAPEYQWAVSPDGTQILIGAERDGNTVSPERGVYLVDLAPQDDQGDSCSRGFTPTSKARRPEGRRTRMFQPIAADVRRVVARRVGRAHLRLREGALRLRFEAHLEAREPAGVRVPLQHLQVVRLRAGVSVVRAAEPRSAARPPTSSPRCAARSNPELVYVVSSHYDSVVAGPGADDDTSGTAALLEAARVLAGHPMPATIVFASFTGEEAGLLGSREFVRRAVADKVHVVGALNNDMIGWMNDHRLDNTIRYSNPGIRDIQHAAAMLFTRLITYDALYFKRHRRGVALRRLRRHRRRHRVVSGARQPALSSGQRSAGIREPPAHRRDQQDDDGDADAAGVEPVAADAAEGGQLHAEGRHRCRGRRARRVGIASYIVAYGPAADRLRHRRRGDAAAAVLPSDRAGQRRVGESRQRARPRRRGTGRR